MGGPEIKQDTIATHKSRDCAQFGMWMISMITKSVIKVDYVTPTIHGRLKYTINSGLKSAKPTLSDIKQVRKCKRSVRIIVRSFYLRKFFFFVNSNFGTRL
jgi:hypothetical protein